MRGDDRQRGGVTENVDDSVHGLVVLGRHAALAEGGLSAKMRRHRKGDPLLKKVNFGVCGDGTDEKKDAELLRLLTYKRILTHGTPFVKQIACQQLLVR